jgi:hypothetical protein
VNFRTHAANSVSEDAKQAVQAGDDAAPLHFVHSACVIVALLVAAALIRMNEHFAVYW